MFLLITTVATIQYFLKMLNFLYKYQHLFKLPGCNFL